ncbi:MAG: GNAT family N-acetyltransferase [Candidatus Saccharibacteria bacterium]|nr:GNAT family N-acetyltransferase [Candidatus Saccharibacteria bacterium]
MKEKHVIGEDISFAPIGVERIGEAMKFQADIIKRMNNKDFFTPLTKQEFVKPIKGRDNVYFLTYKNELIGLAVATCDIPEILLDYKITDKNVMLIDSIMIKKEFRGFGLQKQVLELLEKRVRELGLDGLVATVHPENIYSLRNFLEMGYLVLHSALLHGGERLVLCKKIA